ncbi:hypothetical protein ACJX0J_016350, partial [Zea mays]
APPPPLEPPAPGFARRRCPGLARAAAAWGCQSRRRSGPPPGPIAPGQRHPVDAAASPPLASAARGRRHLLALGERRPRPRPLHAPRRRPRPGPPRRTPGARGRLAPRPWPLPLSPRPPRRRPSAPEAVAIRAPRPPPPSTASVAVALRPQPSPSPPHAVGKAARGRHRVFSHERAHAAVRTGPNAASRERAHAASHRSPAVTPVGNSGLGLMHLFKVKDVAHRGSDPTNPEQLCSQSAAERVASYGASMMSEHGQDYDWMNQPIDPLVVYASGGGKPHGCYPMFGSVIDSTQVRPERSHPSRSSSRGPRSSTQGNAELIRVQEALRRQEEYNKQRQEYWAAQFARQQEMMQQIALGQRPDFSAMTMPPPPPIPQF